MNSGAAKVIFKLKDGRGIVNGGNGRIFFFFYSAQGRGRNDVGAAILDLLFITSYESGKMLLLVAVSCDDEVEFRCIFRCISTKRTQI